MKQMKRAAGLLLALVLVLSMAACGKKDGDGGDSQSGFQRGTIENGIYTNTFVGIGCLLFVLGFIVLIGLLLFGIL